MADTTNEKVIFWAHGQVGQQIGHGECWDLAEEALSKAGAEGSAKLGPMGHDADYVWGTSIEIKDAQPGDVLQFRNFTVTTTTVTKVTFTDGSGGFTDTEEKVAPRGHHTAIVDSIAGPGMIQILEQHVKPLGKKVQLHLLYTQDRKAHQKTSHKMVRTERGQLKAAQVTETVTIKATGKIWAYRPKPKSK